MPNQQNLGNPVVTGRMTEGPLSVRRVSSASLIGGKPYQGSSTAVDTRSGWYDEMAVKWEKVDALLAGTEAMRKRGLRYLPKFPLEGDDFYDWRLKTAVLTNFFKHMADQMVGKIFAKSIEVKTPIPKEILEDIDRQGSSIHTIARQLAFDIITKGVSHVFVDYSRLNGEITAREAKERNVRPFWVRICPENLFAASTRYANDEDRLSQVRWNEIGTEILGFDERQYLRIRCITERYVADDEGRIVQDENGKPIADGLEWQIWETSSNRLFPPSKERSLATSAGYVMTDRGSFDLSQIPLVTAYADRTGFFTSSLPLEDVAHLNILHWQAASDLNNIIRLSQAPLFFMRGFKDRPEAKGANIVYFAEGEGEDIQYADMKYVEPTGRGIEAGENYLDRIIREAQMIGVRMFERARSVETATGETLEKIDDASPLQLIALALESQLKRSLDFTCQWLDLPMENEVRVNKDFAFTGDEAKAADAVGLAFANGVLTGETYLDHLREYGILKRSVDVKKEATAAAAEFEDRAQKALSRTKTAEGIKGALNMEKADS